MNLQAEKLTLVKYMLDINDRNLIQAIKTLVNNWGALRKERQEKQFTEMMTEAFHEIKLHQKGEIVLKPLEEALHEL